MPDPDIWFLCKVVSTGSDESGNVLVKLTTVEPGVSGVTFDPIWLNAVDISKKEMLSTALSAIATGLNVDAMIRLPGPDGKPIQGSTLYRLYIRSSA
jgi:hypothetical protein